MNTIRNYLLITTLVLSLVTSVEAQDTRTPARVSQTVSYQALVTDASGHTLPDGDYSLTVRLYADSSNLEWEDVYDAHVTNGVVTLELGSQKPLPSMEKPLWLGLQIGNTPELGLTKLSAVPYALSVADSAITRSKMATDYVGSISVNGEKLTDRGTDINLITGSGLLAVVDPKTNSVYLQNSGAGSGNGGSHELMSTHWDLGGNSGTTSSDYFGTTDQHDLSIRTNALEHLHISTSGNVGINTSTPSYDLDVNGQAHIAVDGTIDRNLVVGSYFGSGGNIAFSGYLEPDGNSGQDGQVLASQGSTAGPHWVWPTLGTVTSVGLAMPSIFSVTNSPVTSTGTLTASLTTEPANTVFAGPSSGADQAPTFRALTAADISTATSDLAWGLTGNAGTTSSNFVGTTDNQPLKLEVNSGLSNSLVLNTNGSIQRNYPALPGNARGSNAVDLQGFIQVSSQVASGSSSVIGGGYDNTASGQAATVGGGNANSAGNPPGFTTTQNGAQTVSGGSGNYAYFSFSTVGGGNGNQAISPYTAVAGGQLNIAGSGTNGPWAFVGGGVHNIASGKSSFVGGGGDDYPINVFHSNTASGFASAVVGGTENTASGEGSFVGGGGYFSGVYMGNVASGNGSVVTGGYDNSAAGALSTIAGGLENEAAGDRSTIGGGFYNRAYYRSTIAGGWSNLADGNYATIGGGSSNQASGNWSTTSGGFGGNASANGAFVGGGGYDGTTYAGNTASGTVSVVIGGFGNTASAIGSFVGGGGTDGTSNSGNTASAAASVVTGGLGNTASGIGAFVGGGAPYGGISSGNTASGPVSAIAGGSNNRATGDRTFIGAGSRNLASGSLASICGGESNTADALLATIGGGQYNQASYLATVGGGYHNTASGHFSTVAGGDGNLASGLASFSVGGWPNAGNTASGYGSTVVGGGDNIASGDFSVTLGGRSSRATQFGQIAHAQGYFGNHGDAQTSVFLERKSTSDNATGPMYLDGTSQLLHVPVNETFTFHALVTARSASGTSSDGWIVDGLIHNNGGTYSLDASSVTQLGSTTWSVAVNTTGSALNFDVTGAASTNIRWVARIETAEVGY